MHVTVTFNLGGRGGGAPYCAHKRRLCLPYVGAGCVRWPLLITQPHTQFSRSRRPACVPHLGRPGVPRSRLLTLGGRDDVSARNCRGYLSAASMLARLFERFMVVED